MSSPAVQNYLARAGDLQNVDLESEDEDFA